MFESQTWRKDHNDIFMTVKLPWLHVIFEIIMYVKNQKYYKEKLASERKNLNLVMSKQQLVTDKHSINESPLYGNGLVNFHSMLKKH